MSMIFWLVVSFLFFIMELVYPGLFFFLSFCVGSLVVVAMSWLSLPFLLQGVIFLIVSLLAFPLLYLLVNQWFMTHLIYRTNMHAMQGKKGIVVQDVSLYERGTVIVQGQKWSAYTHDDRVIKKGDIVEVVNIRGVHLIIKEVKESV